ncbi:response regulator [Chloroflexota bacterium]
MISKSEQFTIMLIEDDPADLKLIKSVMDRRGLAYSIVIKNSTEEGLDFLSSCNIPGGMITRPDLIILDLNMPGLGGREFLRVVKTIEMLKQIPVVVLTSSTSDRDIVDSYKLQAAGFVTKPAGLKDLEKSLYGITEYWFTFCKLPLKEV